MVNLTFGEQVKIILSRKGMTIKQLAELVEQRTGKPMSRQNMTQRLGRDNFQEQDMRLIAEILGCKFQLSIMEMEIPDAEIPVREEVKIPVGEELDPLEREITVGELIDMAGEPDDAGVIETEVIEPEAAPSSVEEVASAPADQVQMGTDVAGENTETVPAFQERELLKKGIRGYFKKAGSAEVKKQEAVKTDKVATVEKPAEEAPVAGDINPYTGKEYKSNSVRMHPKRIGYVQVYDQEQHKWTDMTEWAFLGYQERKKVLLGKDYEPPIYLD